MFELEWNKLADRVVPQAREISRFPANRRDIAVVVAENVYSGYFIRMEQAAQYNTLTLSRR